MVDRSVEEVEQNQEEVEVAHFQTEEVEEGFHHIAPIER